MDKTIFYTILAGAGTFVTGQIILKLVIDPVQEFKRTISDIAHSFIMHANIYGNPGMAGSEKEQEVSNEMRQFSSKLNAYMHLIPFYPITRFIFGLPSKDNVIKASKRLISLSNGFGGTKSNRGILNSYSAQHASDALGIYVAPHERLDPEMERDFMRD